MPFGAAVNAHMKTQICNGLRARMVLYHYDFCDADGSAGYKLNEHGMMRLADMARMFPCSGFHPIVIERTSCNTPLDNSRREYVVKTLNQINASVPEQLVVVGRPEIPGLAGEEAIPIHRNLMKQTRSGPTGATAPTGAAGSFIPLGLGTMPGLSSGSPGQ
jgi:hypothetical protein